MSTVTTNKTTTPKGKTPKGKDVVKKSPVGGGRSRRARTESEAAEVSSENAPETTEIEVDEAELEDAAGDAAPRRRRVIRTDRFSGVLRPRRIVAAFAIVALLAGGGYAGRQLWENHAVSQAEQQAVATAKDYAVTLTSIDANSIDQNFAEVLDGATGEFKDMYSRSSSQLKQMLVDNKATSKGVVVDAGVKSASTDQVVVMMFVDQSITNTASPEPRVDRSRVLMTMGKVDGRWLASKVDLP